MPECVGAAPIWRCHYLWDGASLRPSPMIAPPKGADVRSFEGPGTVTVRAGARTFVVGASNYMTGRREIAVREVLGGESFLRARAGLGNPRPNQPNGNEYLLVSYPLALWVDGDRIDVVAWKHLLNPP